jgi:exodeoxyribonuclease V alpha subunit
MEQPLRRIERASPPGAAPLDMFSVAVPPARTAAPARPVPEVPAAAPAVRRLPALDLPAAAPRPRLPDPVAPPSATPAGGTDAPWLDVPFAEDAPAGGDMGYAQPQQRAGKPPAGEAEMVEVSGRLHRLVFPRDLPDPDSEAFRIYSLKVGKAEQTLVTTFPVQATVGDMVTARGVWTEYKGKPRFKASIVVADLPNDKAGIVLWMKNLEGVGTATARKLVKHYGETTHEVLDDPEKVAAAGIPKAKAYLISDAWRGDASHRDLIVFLGNLQLGTGIITRIIRSFGASARSIIEQNPWRLAESIEGIGFVTADAIARRHGHSLDKPERIKAALICALREAVMQKGHCGLPIPEMVQQASRLLGLAASQVLPHVDAALDGKGCLFDPVSGLAVSKKINTQEREFAELLLGLSDGNRISRATAESGVGRAERELGIRLDPSQRSAALLALCNPVSIITGGPGTGKSTTMRVVLWVLKDLGRDVVAAAPTGRAAKRLQEVTGVPASTCHRLLSFEDGDFAYGVDKPFKEDWFVVDECSMMDIPLGHSFVSAIKPNSGLTFVGDVDQLPSVGPGQVLRDLIASGAIPTARLDTVHRQQGDSGIITAARRINAGEYPVLPGEKLAGFAVTVKEDPQQIVDQIVHFMCNVLPKHGLDPLQDIQVLTAMRKGTAGVADLNRAIKQALNPPQGPGHTVTFNDIAYSKGDRVMQNRNNYAKEVYNGEIGTVVGVGQREGKNGAMEDFIVVNFGQVEATYGRRDIDEIEQAYAATVHKSQGCEFPYVIIACPASQAHMLDRNLLYTAVTRAKKGCIIVGDPKAVARAVAAKDKNARYTGLAVRLSSPETIPTP